ncbi:hypothetical protein Btru_072860, partial [Bulinus truncatus]
YISGHNGDGFIALISQYFEKRKSFATAVACSGLALGSMGAPPVIKLFIEANFWKRLNSPHMWVWLHIWRNNFLPLDPYQEMDAVNRDKTVH